MLTPQDHLLLQSTVLCWLATADDNGQPNVSPKEIFVPYGDQHLLIANVASPGSAKNIASNPSVAVSCLDIFVQKGIQFKGTAAIIGKDHPQFEEYATPLLALTQGLFPFQTLFLITITGKRPILAPRYLLYPSTTEQDQIKSAMKTYGVKAI